MRAVVHVVTKRTERNESRNNKTTHMKRKENEERNDREIIAGVAATPELKECTQMGISLPALL
jgi:hypothetical protein